MDENLIGRAQRFIDLDTDLKKIDEDIKILLMPADSSSSSQAEILKAKLEELNHPLFESTFNQHDIEEIPNA